MMKLYSCFMLRITSSVYTEHGLTTLYGTGLAIAVSPFHLGVIGLDVSHSHEMGNIPSYLHFSSYVLSPEIYILSVAQSLSQI